MPCFFVQGGCGTSVADIDVYVVDDGDDDRPLRLGPREAAAELAQALDREPVAPQPQDGHREEGENTFSELFVFCRHQELYGN